jgi:hypothetical protein
LPGDVGWPDAPEHLYKISGGLTLPGRQIPGSIDTAAQRAHGWALFAGATRSSGAPDSLPIFHTWYTVEEAFDQAPGNVDCARRNPVVRLSLPTQLLMETPNPIGDALRKKGIEPGVRFDPNPGSLRTSSGKLLDFTHDGVVAFSHVAFNQEMYDFIRSNKYYSKDELDNVAVAGEVRTPIKDPPLRSVSLKLSWWPISPTELTPMPVWDDDPRFAGDAKNPPITWKRVIVVDPTNTHSAPASIRLGDFDHESPALVSIDKLYAITVSAEEADLANLDFRIKSAATSVLGRPLQEGDYLALTAMHIATREFEPWVFTTYWWHDKPDDGPLAKDRPASISGVWRNYIMDVSYNINNPKTETGAAPVAYNPWLELFQAGGTRSQCMACHARAAYGPGVRASFNPTNMATTDPNGFEASPTGANDSVFQPGTVSLHRIWTIMTRAQ